jgi:hypothetical protein
MSTTTTAKMRIPDGVDTCVLARMLEEGYGPGAWHGLDLHAALNDVTAEMAFWRPAPERHNIAEIALHHAFYTRTVRGQLEGTTPEPFVLEGEDWFTLSSRDKLTWREVTAAVAAEQRRLASVIADTGAGRCNPFSPRPNASTSSSASRATPCTTPARCSS